MPKVHQFSPDGTVSSSPETVTLTVDEYETIRLIDLEGLSQEECGAYMQIARTTVQQIYNIARRKIALALVNGYVLKIEGGNYMLCREHSSRCSHGECIRHCRSCRTDCSKQEENT